MGRHTGMEQSDRSHQDVLDATKAAEAGMKPQSVPVNVYETTSALVIVAAVPAVTPSDVNIELRDGQVRFWAGLRSEGTREYLVREWSYGSYEREIEVPPGYGSGVEASLANGQLAIRVLKGDFGGDVTIQPNPHPLDND